MGLMPLKVERRLVAGLKRFQPILTSARARDVNESDTVLIVTDLLAEMFGYDKYTEITSEFVIRGTYCDLAIVIDGKLRLLIEVKAIGLDLKDSHTKQAVDYAANQGIEWVILTNGICWRIYRLTFSKPISQEMVLELNLLSLNRRAPRDIQSLYILTREGLKKASLTEYYDHRQAMNRFSLGAIITTEPVLKLIRRELRRLSPGLKVSILEVKSMIIDEVLKRDIIEGEKAAKERKRIRKAIRKRSKAKTSAISTGTKASESQATVGSDDSD